MSNDTLQTPAFKPPDWMHRHALPLAFLALGLGISTYYIVGWLAGRGVAYKPSFWLDDAIPLQPPWVIIYGSIYFLMSVALLVVRDLDLLLRGAAAYLLVLFVSAFFFLMWPTIASRPTDLPQNEFFPWALSVVYILDPIYNCFPSLHVSEALITGMVCWKVHRKLGIFTVLWAIAISVSTLFTKQHYVADVLAASILGPASGWFFLRNYHPPAPQNPGPQNPVRPQNIVGPRDFVGLQPVCWILVAYTCLVASFALVFWLKP